MITSTKNDTIKQWMKLHKKKYREQMGQFLLEGDHLVEEVIGSDWEIEQLIVREDRQIDTWFKDYRTTVVTDQVFKALANTPSPQGVMAVVNIKTYRADRFKKILVLDNVQDPGNVGTMIRTADAFNYDGIILGEGTVDLFNDKVIRSTQGSLFHLPVVKADLNILLPDLQARGVQLIASTLEEAIPLAEVKVFESCAVIVGNEGSGVQKELQQLSDMKVKIPITGKAESLNVGVAAGILLYYFQ
ncbi:RNA methyltransferase, TrmH family [Halolactibacillus halophilus]|uniref:23S rRNA methyltransferase n=1 Tax=Halolactibacillus halophilus TaxID=306540 RepID=A0A1I5L3L9_9BACI|nr:RNA methyltransferase [Halolactibacillus halophilus]GEM00632.1 23S rRNA methyltransferase [Halolactibacillus halophilus]SFO91783.1 RNA methyltransferase, TrmH family [Halolactibacillus halophilus]